MCGICGQFNFKSQAPASRDAVLRMTGSIAHRGPDDEGFYFSNELGLGFRRLSIIDLEGGHQPMSDVEESVWVVFNGEIYNFPELKQELEGYGHQFRTRSDTETLVHGYKQWGLDVFNHLNGMFGVAIWDERRRRLVIARDAMGIKGVYYRIDDQGVSFGSEMRAVLTASPARPEVDPVALSLFLRYRYTPAPYTLVRGIRKLAAGTMLVCENGAAHEERWYRYTPQPFAPMPSDDEAQEELIAIYRRAMKRHLLSDVPVGLLLSGGLDSSLLLRLMNEHGSQWPTYTVGYGASFSDDELGTAAESSRLIGSQHTSVQLDEGIFADWLPRIVKAVEEPIAASSIVPMYLVCQRARQDVKVVLVGQGPDELFGGYKRHVGVRYGGYWAGLPSWMRGVIGGSIRMLPRNEMLKRGAYALDASDRLERYDKTLSLMPADSIRGVFRDGVLPGDAETAFRRCHGELSEFMQELDELGGLQLLELRSTLPDELLMYGDKLSMAHGLEARVPYLDKEVVEWVQRLDATYKVRRLSTKWLHRRVCERMLPAPILQRKKRGFAVNVVDDWFRAAAESKMRSMLTDPSSRIYGLLRHAPVNTLLQKHVSGEDDNHKLLFSLVVLEEWLREHGANVG
jgi:asparagine synthase (glutamine-hydrolysing)